MKTITLEIYSLSNPKNWKSNGSLSKRAVREDGSCKIDYGTGDKDNDNRVGKHIEWLKNERHYSNMHTGYVDNKLFMTNEKGEQCVAMMHMTSEMFPAGIMLGFSSYFKTK